MNALFRPVQSIQKCVLGIAFLGLILAPSVWATIPLYDNPNNLVYTIPGNPPPQIDATAFLNEAGGSFTYNDFTFTPGTSFFEPVNTLFFTNSGTMIANGSTSTNGVSIFTLGSTEFGVGYQFDLLQSSVHRWADTFYNPGTIRCASTIDGNDTFLVNTFFGSTLFSSTLFSLNTFGQCIVGATNVIVPGTIEVSEEGKIGFAGRNVNLQGGNFVVEPPLFLSGLFGTVPFSGFGTAGVNTNVLWDPAQSLTTTTAASSWAPFPNNILVLNNSQAYLDDELDPFNNNTIIHRAVFIQDQSDTNYVTHNVYFDPLFSSTLGFEPGTMNVGWTSTRIDPASGAPITTYLYLVDNPVFGATTNVAVLNGVPDNFELFNFSSPQFFNPAPVGPVVNNEFPNAFMTNFYAYMNGTVTAATASTNVSASNPHGTVTNLPGQILITASNELNLAFTTISGPNYLSLNCTNQFDGSPGAAIAAPYSDIALGVTNGSLTISNVLMGQIPNWSGKLIAWSTRFVTIDTTFTPNITNDYRVMIVASGLLGTTGPWVKNLYLHGTNSLVLSDPMTVYGSIYSDAATFTLNTNQVGVGATSLDGELVWNNALPLNFNSGSGTQQFPNVLWLTNNGAIRALNNFNFGNSAAPQYAVTPGAPPSTNYSAFVNHSTVSDVGSSVWASYFINDGLYLNGSGSFVLHAGQAVLTNGLVSAAGDVTLVATNVPLMGMNGLLVSNLTIQAGHALTLVATNISGDATTNGNIWSVGATSGGGTIDSGFNIPIKPPVGDLLGTTVTNIAPFNKTIYNVWAGNDYGVSARGYTNNLALGHLVLDSLTTNVSGPIAYNFSGAGVSNAMYVDLLELAEGARFGNITNNYNFPWFKAATNMVVYYARAVKNVGGQLIDISEVVDQQSRIGANSGRLRWVNSYAGFYSATNIYTTNALGVITTNTVNIGLAQSSTIDSDGDGRVNSLDPTPFLASSELNLRALVVTNQGSRSVKVQWTTIPNATNFVYYTTNLMSTNGWQPFAGFGASYYGNNVTNTHPAVGNSFISPQPYLGANASLPDNAYQTNVWIYDAVTNVPHYYKVVVWPWLSFPE